MCNWQAQLNQATWALHVTNFIRKFQIVLRAGQNEPNWNLLLTVQRFPASDPVHPRK